VAEPREPDTVGCVPGVAPKIPNKAAGERQPVVEGDDAGRALDTQRVVDDAGCVDVAGDQEIAANIAAGLGRVVLLLGLALHPGALQQHCRGLAADRAEHRVSVARRQGDQHLA
jgi:hypothetical protein